VSGAEKDVRLRLRERLSAIAAQLASAPAAAKASAEGCVAKQCAAQRVVGDEFAYRAGYLAAACEDIAKQLQRLIAVSL